MQFNSVQFLVFFPIVVGIYFLIPKKFKYLWLLVTSYFFYMSWNAKYALLIAFSTIITYLAGLFLGKTDDKKKKNLIVAASFTVNLGILAFFKYFDFLLGNVNGILSAVGLKIINNPFDVLLPVGISFYTFQALGYTIDVYRKEIEPEKNFFRYALFVSFFPQLVAGPIERSKNLLGQIDEMSKKRLWDYSKIVSGFGLMLWGMFQKVVVADRCAVFVDAVHANLFAAGTVETVASAILFSIQIYCDFAGYSAVAIGAARVMGFSLMENFNTPYFATSIQDFWRRWHVSLSSWFRDYLYIPLGGSRCSKLKKYRNIMITFLASGLWHGASWTFVFWGGLHGAFQIIGDLLRPIKQKINDFFKVKTEAFSYKLGQIMITYGLTTFAWIFFRARTWENLILYFNRMLTKPNLWIVFGGGLDYLNINRDDVKIVVAFLGILLLGEIVRYVKKVDVGEYLWQQNLWFRIGVFIVLIVIILVYGEYGIHFDSGKFIYFDF
ncbi:MAG: MBOAT family protein [Lachnospiraceae bacterium]|nr:MBOAT family protein [Lachnospiraceae bacterium]MCR5500592.1 MBOAT family protein [Acetatifactor sp.]